MAVHQSILLDQNLKKHSFPKAAQSSLINIQPPRLSFEVPTSDHKRKIGYWKNVYSLSSTICIGNPLKYSTNQKNIKKRMNRIKWPAKICRQDAFRRRQCVPHYKMWHSHCLTYTLQYQDAHYGIYQDYQDLYRQCALCDAIVDSTLGTMWHSCTKVAVLRCQRVLITRILQYWIWMFAMCAPKC